MGEEREYQAFRDESRRRSLGVQTWAEHRRAHPGVCGPGRHDPSDPVLTDDSTRVLARAVVRCLRCGAYLASFEGPLRAVQAQLSAPRS